MAQLRDTSRQEAGMSPRGPEQLFLLAMFVRREPLIGGRFAPWPGAAVEKKERAYTEDSEDTETEERRIRGFCEEVGRGVGQGYFA
jgi:hypothetical protein